MRSGVVAPGQRQPATLACATTFRAEPWPWPCVCGHHRCHGSSNSCGRSSSSGCSCCCWGCSNISICCKSIAILCSVMSRVCIHKVVLEHNYCKSILKYMHHNSLSATISLCRWARAGTTKPPLNNTFPVFAAVLRVCIFRKFRYTVMMTAL